MGGINLFVFSVAVAVDVRREKLLKWSHVGEACRWASDRRFLFLDNRVSAV